MRIEVRESENEGTKILLTFTKEELLNWACTFIEDAATTFEENGGEALNMGNTPMLELRDYIDKNVREEFTMTFIKPYWAVVLHTLDRTTYFKQRKGEDTTTIDSVRKIILESDAPFLDPIH